MLALFVIAYNALSAQVSTTIDVRAPVDAGYGMVQYNNPSELGAKKQISVSDDDVAGSPFWKNDWNKAYVFLSSGKVIGFAQAKMNLKTDELYFLLANNFIEAADANNISKIIFVDKKDSSKTIAVFQKLNDEGAHFFQVLNAGKYQFLKKIIVNINKRDYNAFTGKDEYAYEQKTAYYILADRKLAKLELLNKQGLATIIHFSQTEDTWLEENKNKLKSEADWISFLNYYNGKS